MPESAMTEYVNKTKIPSSLKEQIRKFASAKGVKLSAATRLLLVEGLTATGYWPDTEHTVLVDTDSARGG